MVFTMADAEHYIGLVALITSLRLRNEVESITVLDLGLSPWQRAELESSCRLVRLDVVANASRVFLGAVRCAARA